LVAGGCPLEDTQADEKAQDKIVPGNLRIKGKEHGQ
jgi:hypothetical protein